MGFSAGTFAPHYYPRGDAVPRLVSSAVTVAVARAIGCWEAGVLV